jgi:hypothetical protein
MRIGRAVIVPAALVLGIAGASITGTAATAAPAGRQAVVAVAQTYVPNAQCARTLPLTLCHS